MFEIKINEKENVEKFLEFEKTIPFRYSYGFLGMNYPSSKKTISITINSTKKITLYKIILEWIEKNKISYKLRHIY